MRNGIMWLAFAASCVSGNEAPPEATVVQPPAECQSLWTEAADLVELFSKATQPGPPVWLDYGLETGSYAIYAGESGEGSHCLGAWKGGQAQGYAALSEEPNLPTRLYGYLLPWKGNGGPFDGLVDSYAQPDEIRDWLEGIGIQSAVIISRKPTGLPFEISTLKLVQLTIHEGFHVAVQAPRWLASRGPWPNWDLQPDRSGVRSCYSGESIEPKLAEERKHLDDLINGLLDESRETACQAGRDFLKARMERYALLENVEVADHEGKPGTCRAAEAIMELEEGTADYASWSRLYHLGHASREELIGRYNARQADVYYLTGGGQLHALYLMNPDGFLLLANEIANSADLEQGSITNLFRRELASYCE